MKKAVFLDRDGTINKEVNNLRDINQLRLLPNVAKAIRKFGQNHFLIIMITNQPVVARGWITEKQLEEIHMVLMARLKKQGARIDAIYYCPHHPNANFKKYKKDCSDRKPNIGLINKAVKDFNISLKDSFLIGDSTTDIKTANNADIKNILVKTGYAGKDKKFDVSADYIAKDLLEAVSIVCKH